MPEQLTRHPDVTLQVLRSAGARCGEGAPQEILTACPRERFCRLPGGEVCVYGLPQAREMTQITGADWAALAPPQATPVDASWQIAAALVAGIAVGALAALVWRRRPRAGS
jgi:hypothetical protein